MKKVLALAIALASACTLSATALAADTTTLTTTVPDATYTLNIPADQDLSFGATSTNIGNITVTDSSGFAKGKDLEVTATYEPFTCDSVETVIPYKLFLYYGGAEYTDSVKRELPSGDSFIFRGTSAGSVEEKVWLKQVPNLSNGYWQIYMENFLLEATSEDWGMALAGDYSSTITFTSEVVVSE